MKRTESTSSPQILKKTQPEEFDLVILGGGTGSTVAAWTFAGEGKRVAVVDRKYIGGSCPNIACLPSKNIIHSAKVASYFRRSEEFGITCDGFAIDMEGVRERKRGMVRGLNEMIDRNGRLMSKEDPDVCEALRSLLADEGIDILLNARIKQVSGKSGDSVSVVLEQNVEQNGIEKVLKGSHILVATGRNPNTEGLGLELTGVELTDRGYIKVNERLQTTAPGVWAIGEVAGSPQFTHISIDDFRVVHSNLTHANLTGGNRVTRAGKSHIVCLPTPNLLVSA
jgi:pyruvate/2-oxoglutarate dehydrogenase complex dihydrolipoamide dehydrogenase (E3) component